MDKPERYEDLIERLEIERLVEDDDENGRPAMRSSLDKDYLGE